MVLLFYTFNETKFSGLWNHSNFITLVTVCQPQNSHSSNATGLTEKKKLACSLCVVFQHLNKSQDKSPPLLKNEWSCTRFQDLYVCSTISTFYQRKGRGTKQSLLYTFLEGKKTLFWELCGGGRGMAFWKKKKIQHFKREWGKKMHYR